MLPQFLQTVLQSVLQEAPKHLWHKGVEIWLEREHEKEAHAIHATLEAFITAILEQKHIDALILCTPELQKVLQAGEGVVSSFTKVQAHLTNATDINLAPVALDPLNNTCHLKGIITYQSPLSANYALDMLKHGSDWKVNRYNFDAIPPPPVAKPQKPRKTVAPSPASSGAPPSAEDTCPDGYAIKGSANKIYHLPDGRFYAVVRPVRCFATEAGARSAGFRPSQRG
jgi:hypothetical protein